MPKREATEPKLSVAAFDQRCRGLAAAFSDTLGQERGEIAFTPVYTNTNAVMSVAGRSSEFVNRNIGRPHRVVKLCNLNNDVFSWVGYKENWKKEESAQSFKFFDAGFTIHIGRIGEAEKPQLLRSEWISSHNGGFTNLAGHPHWQLDVLESVRARAAQVPVRFVDAGLNSVVQEFKTLPDEPEETDFLLGLTIERMHLASAAYWWRKPTLPIAHQVETVADLDRWILGCIAYLRQEMQRCIIV